MQPNNTSFTFRTVPEIRIEWGLTSRLGDVLGTFCQARRILIVTDVGLHRAGLLEKAKVSLEAHGFAVSVYDGVVADPPENNATEAAEQARVFQADLVLGFGGGSSLDVAKLAAVLATTDQPIATLYGIDKVHGARLPLVLMPTTAGTGSEVTNITVLSTGETKMAILAPQLYADIALLDAQLTAGLPRSHTAATGIDAMVHAIEAYTSRLKKNPISDALAIAALRMLSSNLVGACERPDDSAAREAMLVGAMLAGQAFANAPVAAVHAFAYPLGGRYHIPHGLSNALMLTTVLRFNIKGAEALYAELNEAVGGSPQDTVPASAESFVSRIADLLKASGAPLRLRDVGVRESDLELMAADAMKQQRLLQNNPVTVTPEDALQLYRQAF